VVTESSKRWPDNTHPSLQAQDVKRKNPHPQQNAPRCLLKVAPPFPFDRHNEPT
jgi:hypothetical protein